MPHVYILRSGRDNGFYVGSTRNLDERLKRHLEGRVPATKNRLPLAMVYCKSFEIYSEAYNYEQLIKKQKSSEYISRLISEK
jgi:putative endonuclease